jgi:predicted Zn-dependent protease
MVRNPQMTGRPPPSFDTVDVQQALQAAVAALQGQRFGEVERIAAGILKDHPQHTVAGAILGRALLLQNRAAEAVPVLEQAVGSGGDPQVETQFADALVATGRRDEALAQLRKAMARRPAFMPSFVVYARYSAEVGGLADGIAALKQGLAIFPGAWEMENELALQLIETNDRAAARKALLRGLAAQPGHPVLLTTLGRVLYLDSDYAAAADVFARVLAANPRDVAAQINLGACRLEMGGRGAGEAELRAAMRAAPQLLSHALAALCHASHGRFFLRPSRAMDFLRGQS